MNDLDSEQEIYEEYERERKRAAKLVKALFYLAITNVALAMCNLFIGSAIVRMIVAVLFTTLLIGEAFYYRARAKQDDLLLKYKVVHFETIINKSNARINELEERNRELERSRKNL